MKRFLKKLCAVFMVLVIGIVFFLFNKIDIVQASTTRNVYFVWTDANEKFHYYKITGVVDIDGDEITNNYVRASSIVDEGDHTTVFNMERNHYFVTEEGMNTAFADSEFTSADGSLKLRYLFENRYAINPCLDSEKAETANSIVTNGDMQFRITIYNDNYVGAKIGVSNGFTYSAEFLGGLFYMDTFDITSGTSKSKPAILESYLLEDEVTLQASSVSSKFTSVTALDVPSGAVDITKNENVFTIKFNSNYYDRVVFKIQTENNKTYYVMIARTALNITEDRNEHEIRSTLYYPDTNSYSDFKLAANITYTDGTKKIKILAPVKEGINDQNIDPFNYETSGGTGLKKCQFLIGNSDTIETVTFTVLKGSLIGSTYNGTFSGSNEGIIYTQVDQYDKKVVYYEGEYA